MVEANPDDTPWIGIDLGTTFSACAIFKKTSEQIETLQNVDTGLNTTPSIVAYRGADKKVAKKKQGTPDVLVGHPAKIQQPRNLENTLYDAKRMIGKTFNDPYIQKLKAIWPFEVVEGE